jgi:hypothetical protein
MSAHAQPCEEAGLLRGASSPARSVHPVGLEVLIVADIVLTIIVEQTI